MNLQIGSLEIYRSWFS